MTNPSQPPAAPDQPSLEEQRQTLQGLLGEHHGLLTTTMNELLAPSASRPSPTDAEMQELFEYLWNAYPSVSVAFGEAQGALNSGNHDEGLEGLGLTQGQLGPKRKGFRYNARRFYSALKGGVSSRAGFIQAAKHALRAVKWGNIIAGSLSNELRKIKGMEVILEFGQVVAETLEQVIDGQEPAPVDKNG